MCSYWGRDRQETGTRWLNLTGAACSPSCIAALRQQRSCGDLVSVSAQFCSWPLHSAATRLLNAPSFGQLQEGDWWMKYMTKTRHPCRPALLCFRVSYWEQWKSSTFVFERMFKFSLSFQWAVSSVCWQQYRKGHAEVVKVSSRHMRNFQNETLRQILVELTSRKGRRFN